MMITSLIQLLISLKFLGLLREDQQILCADLGLEIGEFAGREENLHAALTHEPIRFGFSQEPAAIADHRLLTGIANVAVEISG